MELIETCFLTSLVIHRKSLRLGGSTERFTRDEHGSRLDRTGSGLKPILAGSGLDGTAIFLKIGGSGLDRTAKIFAVFM